MKTGHDFFQTDEHEKKVVQPASGLVITHIVKGINDFRRGQEKHKSTLYLTFVTSVVRMGPPPVYRTCQINRIP